MNETRLAPNETKCSMVKKFQIMKRWSRNVQEHFQNIMKPLPQVQANLNWDRL
jgi:hypothetical protein